MFPKEFTEAIMSDYRFSDLVYAIEYDETSLATVIQEKGFDDLRILFYYPFNQKYWLLPFDKTYEALQRSKNVCTNLEKSDFNEEHTHPFTNQLKIQYVQISECTAIKAQIFIENNLMAEVINSSNLQLLIYPNLDKEQSFHVVQWDVSYDEFIAVLKEIKKYGLT